MLKAESRKLIIIIVSVRHGIYHLDSRLRSLYALCHMPLTARPRVIVYVLRVVILQGSV